MEERKERAPHRPEGGRREGGAREGGPGGRFRRPRRKSCRFCQDRVVAIDYKDYNRIRTFVSDRGKIVPSRMTGTCASTRGNYPGHQAGSQHRLLPSPRRNRRGRSRFLIGFSPSVLDSSVRDLLTICGLAILFALPARARPNGLFWLALWPAVILPVVYDYPCWMERDRREGNAGYLEQNIKTRCPPEVSGRSPRQIDENMELGREVRVQAYPAWVA